MSQLSLSVRLVNLFVHSVVLKKVRTLFSAEFP